MAPARYVSSAGLRTVSRETPSYPSSCGATAMRDTPTLGTAQRLPGSLWILGRLRRQRTGESQCPRHVSAVINGNETFQTKDGRGCLTWNEAISAGHRTHRSRLCFASIRHPHGVRARPAASLPPSGKAAAQRCRAYEVSNDWEASPTGRSVGASHIGSHAGTPVALSLIEPDRPTGCGRSHERPYPST